MFSKGIAKCYCFYFNRYKSILNYSLRPWSKIRWFDLRQTKGTFFAGWMKYSKQCTNHLTSA
jgi:hypothetical protein